MAMGVISTPSFNQDWAAPVQFRYDSEAAQYQMSQKTWGWCMTAAKQCAKLAHRYLCSPAMGPTAGY